MTRKEKDRLEGKSDSSLYVISWNIQWFGQDDDDLGKVWLKVRKGRGRKVGIASSSTFNDLSHLLRSHNLGQGGSVNVHIEGIAVAGPCGLRQGRCSALVDASSRTRAKQPRFLREPTIECLGLKHSFCCQRAYGVRSGKPRKVSRRPHGRCLVCGLLLLIDSVSAQARGATSKNREPCMNRYPAHIT